MKQIIKNKYHYIKYEDLYQKFYNLAQDSQEWKNKVSHLKASVLLNTFRKLAPVLTAVYAPNALINGNCLFKI